MKTFRNLLLVTFVTMSFAAIAEDGLLSVQSEKTEGSVVQEKVETPKQEKIETSVKSEDNKVSDEIANENEQKEVSLFSKAKVAICAAPFAAGTFLVKGTDYAAAKTGSLTFATWLAKKVSYVSGYEKGMSRVILAAGTAAVVVGLYKVWQSMSQPDYSDMDLNDQEDDVDQRIFGTN